MAWSLRRTLAVRYSLTMAVALVGVALWAYSGIRNLLRDQLDRSLHSTLELQTLALSRNGRVLTVPPMDEREFVDQINRVVVGRDDQGRIIEVNREFAVNLPLDTAAFRRALAGEPTLADSRWGGRPSRSLYGPAPASATSVAVLEVTASLEPLDRASRGVLHRMIATALLGAAATLVGAAWLARSALAPVDDIAGQARAIQGRRAGQRITAHADVAELQGLIEVLNAMLARLERSAERHRQLIRDLGHDLRTPITTMRAGLEMALWSERRPEQYREILASTIEEVDRMTLISDALTLLARLEAGELSPVLAEADLRSITRQAVDRARERAGANDLRLASPPEPLPARVDARLLGMVLDQLLDNARRHTPPGTLVDVSLESSDGRLTITVEDQGTGVSEDMLPHLFDHFYRGDAARGRYAGFGLGLTLAAAIVQLHAGRIVAERGGAGGLRIRIELPRDSR